MSKLDDVEIKEKELKKIKREIEFLRLKNSYICVDESNTKSQIRDLQDDKNRLYEYTNNLSKSKFFAIAMPIISILSTNLIGLFSSVLINFPIIEVMILMNFLGIFLTFISIDVWTKDYFKIKKFIENNTLESIEGEIEELTKKKNLYAQTHKLNNEKIEQLNIDKNNIKDELERLLINIEKNNTGIDYGSIEITNCQNLSTDEEKGYELKKSKK